MAEPVIIVGGGLAGLCAANRLHEARQPFVLLEASDRVGGRVRTDVVDGFRIDHGFQVFLDSYPEARRRLDLAALRLGHFRPGARVRYGGRFHDVADPWRMPSAALGTVFSGLLPFADLLRVGALRLHVTSGSLQQHLAEPETTTLAALRARGFSEPAIDRFFRPFLGGVFLERDLSTSSRMFEFVFRMFSLGRAGLPAEGMEAIPRQLVATLPAESVRCGTSVTQVRPDGVTLADGHALQASAVVVAVEGPEAARMLGGPIATSGHGVVTLSYAAETPPVREPVLVLDGEGRGPVNHLVVPSVPCPDYAPSGQHLVTATVLRSTLDDAALDAAVRAQLGEWFGAEVSRWRLLRTERIAYALPSQQPPALAEVERPVRLAPGSFVCGDHRDTGSIQGAMVSGRRAADAVLAERT